MTDRRTNEQVVRENDTIRRLQAWMDASRNGAPFEELQAMAAQIAAVRGNA